MAVVNLAYYRQLGHFTDCGYLPPLNRDGTPVVNESWTVRSLTKEENHLSKEARKKLSKFEFQVYDLAR